ncbi:MAG: hypothetical protein KDM91_20215 [Verrucomicrobiae bacterium]|nr:hypothetical protein [Verrucomicrobiae bacterium]MCP5540458.1 hypothetical protein [Akkermansiaceae bacterium]
MSSPDPQRPLAGLAVGLSISESDDSAEAGFSALEVNRTVRRVAEALLGQGARVLFGHDWRADGVMAEVLRFALDYQPSDGGENAHPAPRLINLVAWPRRASLSPDEARRFAGVLEVVECSLPEVLAPSFAAIEADPALSLAAQALALTHMRQGLNDLAAARLCIGGRKSGSSGRFAGVAEEAWLAIETGKPLYLAGLFGGATAEVIRAITGDREIDEAAFRPTEKVAAGLERIGELKTGDIDTLPGAEVLERLRRPGALERLAEANRLSVEENRALFHAGGISEVIALTLTGLGRLPGRA